MRRDANRSELIELYKIAVEEYRFHVTLNWNRSQYYLALNVAIIGVGAGLITIQGTGRLLVGCVFGVGFATAVLSILATLTQQNYYRAAREAKRDLEVRLGLGAMSIKTTRGMGSTRPRFGTVTRFNYALLTILATVDLVGLGYVGLHH